MKCSNVYSIDRQNKALIQILLYSLRRRIQDSVDTADQGEPEKTVDPANPNIEKDDNEEPLTKKARFELGECYQEEDSWELSPCFIEYVHKYIGVHVTDKEIKEHILEQSPLLSNLRKVPELDSHIRNILQQNSNNLASEVRDLSLPFKKIL